VSNNNLKHYQVFVLQLMAQPADTLINDGRWNIDDIPLAIIQSWMTAFTDMETGGSYTLLPEFPEEVIEIDKLLRSRIDDGTAKNWKNSELKTEPMWAQIRNFAGQLLLSKEIPVDNPDPSDWYAILPEELH